MFVGNIFTNHSPCMKIHKDFLLQKFSAIRYSINELEAPMHLAYTGATYSGDLNGGI